MRTQVAAQRQNDPAAYFSLAWTTTISFVLLLTRSSPDPLLFVPVALAALPFAAAPRHQISFRILAAALFAGFLAAQGPGMSSVLFTPAVAALLYSAYRLFRSEGAEQRARSKRSRHR